MAIRRMLTCAFFTLSLILTSCGQTFDESHESHLTDLQEIEHAHAERGASERLAGVATGNSPSGAKFPWPVAYLSIGHTNASYQSYGGAPYFHHGVDIRADAGSAVVLARGGKVVNVENYVPGSPAYWEVAIKDDEGFVWQYHHVDYNSIPQAVHNAFRSGGSLPAGFKIGEVFYWSVVTFGERYHHIHLNILGAGDVFHNPLAFLEPLADHSAPQFVEIGLMKNGKKVVGSKVSGEYSVFATVHDLILHQKFVVPPHELKVSIDGGAQESVWRFDTLPGGKSEKDFVNDFFPLQIACGNYTCRNLATNLGFIPKGARSFPKTPGKHSIQINAADFYGNQTKATFEWMVE